MKYFFFTLLLFSLECRISFAGESSGLLQKGWDELVRDNDTAALKYFGLAYEKAKSENDLENSATALLNIGICSYGVSYSEGLHYCLRAMDEFSRLGKSYPQKALTGRSKCLQLISTIKSRQGKYGESVLLSREAMQGFAAENDTTGYLGLIYNSLGEAYSHLNMPDSSDYYHRMALKERLATKNFIYLPGSYIQVAAIELKKGNKEQSLACYQRALFIADSMGNRQSQVSSLLGMGKWTLTFEKNENKAEEIFLEAKGIAAGISDRSFYLKVIQQLLDLKKLQGKFSEALAYGEEIQKLKDTLATWEKERITRGLEIRFEVAEKDRRLTIMQNEKDIALLTNYLLWGTIGFLVLMSAGLVLFLRKINRRDKMLLKTKEDLVLVMEEQKKLKDQQMQNELEFKESQLSAAAIQMVQKNELFMELKEQLDQETGESKDALVNRLISKGLILDKEWTQFNASFESINKNFYSRLKQAYPEISPNDLKICALIKMNLSIKEMAGILNISPDSVKTARYRLRKKLQLNSEDNLTDFILNLA